MNKTVNSQFEELVLLEDGLRAIGEKAKDFWRKGVTGKVKSCHYDIVTEADPIIEKDIRILIADKYPQAKIVGEELGGEINDNYWAVDSIDGTSAFAAGLPTWSMAIGHVVDKQFTFSIIFVPIGIDGPEFYYAKKGQGAYVNGKKLQVSQKTDLKEANVFIRSHEIRHDKEGVIRSLITDCRMLWTPGSTSIGLAYLAAGKLDVLIAKNQAIWDYPGTLLVQEAGGRVTLTDVENPNPKRPLSKTILATNGFLHEIVSARLRF